MSPADACPGRKRSTKWCAADPGPLRSVAVPDQRCTAPLRFALRRIRDTWLELATISGSSPQKKKRAGRSRRDLACGDYAPSVPQARGVGNLFPMGQAFRDDLGRLQRRLAQGGVFDDLALHARGLALQRITQRLQLGDELVDFLHRRPCYPLQELVDVVGHQFAVALRLAPNAHYVAADEFADFPFHFRFRRGLDFGALTRLENGHSRYPRSAPLRAELRLPNSRMRM